MPRRAKTWQTPWFRLEEGQKQPVSTSRCSTLHPTMLRCRISWRDCGLLSEWRAAHREWGKQLTYLILIKTIWNRIISYDCLCLHLTLALAGSGNERKPGWLCFIDGPAA